VEKSIPKNWATSEFFNKLPKVKQSAMCEKLQNLVTLSGAEPIEQNCDIC
jgi:hypothetical protein